MDEMKVVDTNLATQQVRGPSSYKKSLAQVGKGAGIVTIGALIGSGLEYLTRTILARSLGPDGFGLFNLGYSVMLLGATFSLLGMGSGLTRFVAFYQGRQENTKTKGVILAGVQLSIPVILFLTVVLWLGAGWISQTLFHKPELAPLLRLFALSLPLIALSQLQNAILRGLKEMKGIAIAQALGGSGVRLGLLICLLVFGLGLRNVVLIYTFSFVVILILGGYYLWQRFPWAKIAARRVAYRELLSYSWPLILADIMREVERHTEVLILGFFVSATEIGFYSAGFLLGRLLMLPLTGFNRILMPVASELYSQDNHNHVQQLYRSVARWLFYITTPPMLALLFFADRIVILLFSSEYSAAAPVLRILTLGYFSNFVTGSWEQILLANARTKTLLVIKAAWVSTTLILDFIFIPRLGIVGAAWATTLSLIWVDILGLGTLYYYERIHPFGLFHLIYLLVSGGMFYLAYFLTAHESLSSFGFLVLIVVTGGLGFVTSIALIRLNEDDRLMWGLVRNKLKPRG